MIGVCGQEFSDGITSSEGPSVTLLPPTLNHKLMADFPLVLPGEIVPASHSKLKLGPGLLQTVSVDSDAQPIITTRAGTLSNSHKGSRWWVEGNSRRVRLMHI
jgi:hypothetical protein